jgi:ammonia channel protein AmtB
LVNSLVFAEGSPFVGGLKYLFLDGVGKDPNTDYAATIPQGTFMVYQLMFAIITPGLISGAFAERIRFSAMALFSTLWVLIVYFPMAHMVWGKGGLLNAYLGGAIRTFDFAGGHRGSHYFGRLSVGVRTLSRQARRVSERADEAAQHGSEHDRRLPVVGPLVRL